MPRYPRKKSLSGIYHIMMRGVNKQTIFEDEEDKFKFLKTLKKYKKISNYQIYSYCLMDNHVHLLLKESVEPLAEIIKRISSSYVYAYNMKYERCGHLFQDRFKSEIVENRADFFKVLRYIHQNPLKAGLAVNVFESKWTSINEYFREESIVDIDFALNLLSPDRKTAVKLFMNYMDEPNDDQCLDDYLIKVRMTDSEVTAYLNEIGISSISALQQMEKKDRDHALIILKELSGVSIRQLSRITGISKSVIQRVK